MIVEDADSAEITRDTIVALPENQPFPRVCIFGAFNAEYAPLAEMARPNWIAYGERHGYAVRFYSNGYHLDPSRPKSYGDKNRFNWYFDLKGHCDIVMYLDIDSLFVDMDVSVGDTLRYDSNGYLGRPFLWTYADGGPMSGLMIARTDDATERHLRYAYEHAAASNNVRHGKIEPNGISDQDSMTRLMNIPPFSRTFGNCVEAESIGFCFPDTKVKRPWIISCRGGSIGDKLAALTPWLARTTQPA